MKRLKLKIPPRLLPLLERIVLAAANVWVWGLDALQPAPGDSEGVPGAVSPLPFRLGIAFCADAGGSLGDPRVPAFLEGRGGEEGGKPRHKQGKFPIYRGKGGKIPSRSSFWGWRGGRGLCPPLVCAAPFPAFCGFQRYLLSNFWRPSGDFWPRDGWLRPLGWGHGQVQPLRTAGTPPPPPPRK